MWTRHHKRRNTGKLIVPAITVVVLSYFGFHAYQGDYGLNAKARLEVRIDRLEADLAVLEKTRQELEERLSLLQDGSLEKDMLDEQVRRALILARENEIVILTKGDRNKPDSG
ncbi:septum formation initiator family protein [Chelativorans sp. SCAU2101]|jgi:Septum formation initiator|uniref:Septum formation initiator family protein n=1 Tax=Chelativorans petroleitrophicus TaxID=2975484 RepID=A0A9X2XC78_9HYPH|nr:septum formation initiator family protein [Chelativorans petroleitrophicus]MCT8991742.1 septum formation initiator family protein [Chelativorans petroleitrophicus]